MSNTGIEDTTAPSSEAPTETRSIPDNAAPEAGGPRPESATEVRTRKTDPNAGEVAVFTLPAGAVSCAITSTALRCGIENNTSAQQGSADDTVVIEDGNAELTADTGAAPWESMAFGADDTVVPQLVTYGETVYYEGFVCVNADDALTCWDTDSGAGAVLTGGSTTLF